MATTRTTASELVPGDDRRCVWMSAGLVAWKLCDRDFDCERCPFDRAMRGGEAGPSPEPEEPRPAAGAAASAPAATPRRGFANRFPDDRRYHPAHTWVVRTAGGRARIGLDAFAARLAGEAGAVIVPAAGSPLRQGEVACWLTAGRAGAGPIPVRSPVSGTVRRRNPRVGEDPSLVAASPYDEGWLLEVDLAADGQGRGGAGRDRVRAEDRRLLAAEEARERSERQLAELLAEASSALGEAGAGVGPTLPDGGEPLADLGAVLGAERYRRLVLRYLGSIGAKVPPAGAGRGARRSGAGPTPTGGASRPPDP